MKAALQRFKIGDETEEKVIQAAIGALDDIGVSLDQFFEQAFKSYGLGAALYDLGRDPMVGVVTRETFLKSYWAIHNLFTAPGTFEYYLEVFRAIWGDSVQIEFEVPEGGHLIINAEVLDLEEFNLVARRVENDLYVYHRLIDRGGDYLMARDTTGIKTQSEIDALMNEITPNGVFVETTLTL